MPEWMMSLSVQWTTPLFRNSRSLQQSPALNQTRCAIFLQTAMADRMKPNVVSEERLIEVLMLV